MNIQRLTHMGICTANLEQSVRFYREALDCVEVGRLELEGEPAATLNEIEDVKLRAVYLERDGWRLELLEFCEPGSVGSPEARPMNQIGLTHLAFRVDDIDAVCDRIVAEGGSLLLASRTGRPTSRVRAVMALDPDGTRIELIQGPGDPNAVPGSDGWLSE